MGYFDANHLETAEVSDGPAFGFWESAAQGARQIFRVDSPLAVPAEVEDRWSESLTLWEQATGKQRQSFNMNDLQNYARLAEGEQIDDLGVGQQDIQIGNGYGTFAERMERIRAVDEDMKGRGIKSLADIMAEVVGMQQRIEERTGVVSQRGSTTGLLLGEMAGSLSPRDPATFFTLPIGGFGKTVARRVLTEALVGGVTSAPGEFEVEENRRVAGLPEHSVAGNIAIAAAGAGAFQGLLAEPIGALVRRWANGGELSDTEVKTVLDTASESPRARAASSILEDDLRLDALNPYGETRLAQDRFLAELREVQQVLGGTPETAIARVEIPPLPFEIIEKAADFEIVKEHSPAVWRELEEAQADFQGLRQPERVLLVHGGSRFDNIDPARFGSGEPGGIRPLGNGLYGYAVKSSDQAGLQEAIKGARVYAEKYGKGEKAIQIYEVDTASSQIRFNGPRDKTFGGAEMPEAERAVLDLYGEADKLPGGSQERRDAYDRAREADEATPKTAVHLKGERLPGGLFEMAALDPSKLRLVGQHPLEASDALIAKSFGKPSKKRVSDVNKRYQAAHAAVEAERAKLVRIQEVLTGKQREDARDLLGFPTSQRPFIGPLLRHDVVEARVEELNRMAEALDAEERPRFVVDEETGTVDIQGAKLSLDMTIPVERDGGFAEVSVKDILDDLEEDFALEQAVRSCAV